jgi:arylsulfatase A-like enzyme
MRVVIVVVDSLRPDHLGAYGGAVATPTLDGLAASGVRFETAVSSSPWTLPSLAAMLTGRHGHRVGLVHWKQPWPAAIPTLFDVLAAAGWDVASFPFDPAYLFTGLAAAGTRGSSRDDEAVLAFLRAPAPANQLVFLHHWGTHVPYVAGAMPWDAWKAASDALIALLGRGESQAAKVRALYRAAVRRFSEEWLPRILDALATGGRDDTLLVVTADHGETWGERLPPGGRVDGVFDLHGNALYDESIRVPLILHGPAFLPAGMAVGGQARTVDLAPTILDLAGVTAPPGIDGVSLASCCRTGAPCPASRAVVACNRTVAELLALRGEDSWPADAWSALALREPGRKWIWRADGPAEAYDLGTDPGEKRPLDPATPGWEDGWQALRDERARATLVPIPPAVADHERRRAEAARRSVVRGPM